MKKKKFELEVPGGSDKVLLHTCCAPCSSAIIECLLNHAYALLSIIVIRISIRWRNTISVRTSVPAMPSRWAWILWMQIMTMHSGVVRWPDLKTNRSAEALPEML